MGDIFYLFREGKPPKECFGLVPVGAPPTTYWMFRP